ELLQARYLLAMGTAALHLFGSLLLTLAGIKSALLWLGSRAG
ncbi:MAG: fluoride ion transporter CrcB, partial [Hylemonella sp.]|nr:fluoride ion transporter CrcB [Hylemonella sp.]